MSLIVCILAYIIANAVVGYCYPKCNVWLSTNYMLSILLVLSGLMNIVVTVIVLIVFIIITIILYSENIRIIYITTPTMKWFKNKLPKLSQTEAEALESGDCWMEKSLFCGKPDWQWLSHLKLSQPNIEEKSFIDKETTELCALLDDWKIINQDHDI